MATTDTLPVTTDPWERALERLGSKTSVASRLRTADWAMVPAGLRERAFFSAGVDEIRVVDGMRAKLLEGLAQTRRDGTLTDRSRFRAEVRALIGAPEGDSGRLTDLGSRRRLDLIWDFQVADAYGQARHKMGLDPDLLAAYPAQRLVRVESRKVPRDWWVRWGQAGVKVGFEGASRRAMVALKTSPIWAALSRFGRPHPPFDFGSGMGVEEVDWEEAQGLGLVQAGGQRQVAEAARQKEREWNEGLEAGVKHLSAEAQAALELAFGDQVKIENGRAKWKRQAPYTDFAAQGLPSARTWTVSEPMPERIDPAEGRARMEAGETVTDPTGHQVTFGPQTLAHWAGYADENKRPGLLPAAVRAVQAPVERWTQSTQEVWVAAFVRPQGGYRGVVVVATPGGQAITYFLKSLAALDAARKGVAVWRAAP